MIIIGLTGVLGSGKSTVAALLEKRGAEVIDLDALAQDALAWEQTRNDIRQGFGEEYVVGGQVDKEMLARKVFNSEEALKKLESIIHPRVRDEAEKRIQALKTKGVDVVVIDHPLLFEAGFHRKMDKVVVVSTEEALLRKRLEHRGMEAGDVERRLAHQIPLKEKESRADYVVYNNGPAEGLAEEAASLWDKIKKWEENKNAS